MWLISWRMGVHAYYRGSKWGTNRICYTQCARHCDKYWRDKSRRDIWSLIIGNSWNSAEDRRINKSFQYNMINARIKWCIECCRNKERCRHCKFLRKQTLRWWLICRNFIWECFWDQHLRKGKEEKRRELDWEERGVNLQCSLNGNLSWTWGEFWGRWGLSASSIHISSVKSPLFLKGGASWTLPQSTPCITRILFFM